MEDRAPAEGNQGVETQELVRRRVAEAIDRRGYQLTHSTFASVPSFETRTGEYQAGCLELADAAIASFLQVMQEMDLPQAAINAAWAALPGIVVGKRGERIRGDMRQAEFRAILKALASQAKGGGQ